MIDITFVSILPEDTGSERWSSLSRVAQVIRAGNGGIYASRLRGWLLWGCVLGWWLMQATSYDGPGPRPHTSSLASSLSSNASPRGGPGQGTYLASTPGASAASHRRWKNRTRNSLRVFERHQKFYWAKVIQFWNDLSGGNKYSAEYKVHSTRRLKGFWIYTFLDHSCCRFPSIGMFIKSWLFTQLWLNIPMSLMQKSNF